MRTAIHRVPMTVDGWPSWRPSSPCQTCVMWSALLLAIYANIMTIFGDDMLTILFSNHDQYVILNHLLVGIYLLFEFIVFCVFVQGYPFSAFFNMDVLVLCAAVIELLMDVFHPDILVAGERVTYAICFLPILRAIRFASLAIRIGTASKLHFTEVLVTAHGPAAEFGRKGFENDHNVFLYIRQKFSEAFVEMQTNNLITRDEFSSMLRYTLKLDLEAEEEEVLYRVMTVFGRMEEIKVLEDEIHDQEKKRSRYQRRRSLSTKASVESPIKLSPFDSARLPSDSASTTSLTITEQRRQRRSSSVLEIARVATSKVRARSLSTESGSKVSTAANKRNASIWTKPSADDGDDSISKVNEPSSFKQHNALSGRIQVLPKKSSFSHLFFSPNTNPAEVVSSASAPLTSGRRSHSSTPPDFSASSSFSVDGIRQLEKDNPIKLFRAKMATSLLPIDNYSLLWGVDLFRQMENPKVSMNISPLQNILKPNHSETMSHEEYQSRLDEVILINGNRIFDSINALEMKKSNTIRNKRNSSLLFLNLSQSPKATRQRHKAYSHDSTLTASSKSLGSNSYDTQEGSEINTRCRTSNDILYSSHHEEEEEEMEPTEVRSSTSSPMGSTFRKTLFGASSMMKDAPILDAPTLDSNSPKGALRMKQRAQTDPSRYIHTTSMSDSIVEEGGVDTEEIDGSTMGQRDHVKIPSSSSRLIHISPKIKPRNDQEVDISSDLSPVSLSLPADSIPEYLTDIEESKREEPPSPLSAVLANSKSSTISNVETQKIKLQKGLRAIKVEQPLQHNVDIEDDSFDDSYAYSKARKTRFHSDPSNESLMNSAPKLERKSAPQPSVSQEIKQQSVSLLESTTPTCPPPSSIPVPPTASLRVMRFFSGGISGGGMDKKRHVGNRSSSSSITSSVDEGKSSSSSIPTVETSANVSKEYRDTQGKIWLCEVLDKVKEQMREHMKQDIIKNLSYGENKTNITTRAARVTSLCAMLCIVITILAHNVVFMSQSFCMGDTYTSLFSLLKSTVRASPLYEVNSTSMGNVISNSSCINLQENTDVEYIIDQFLLLHPATTFLLKVDGCKFLSNEKLIFKSSYVSTHNHRLQDVFQIFKHIGQQRNSNNLAMSEVQYIPCWQWKFAMYDERAFVENQNTIAGFDVRKELRVESYYSIATRLFVITSMILISILIGRDKATITDKIVTPLSKVAKEMDRVSRFDLHNKLKAPISSTQIKEIRSIEQSFQKMRTTIKSFTKFVPQDVVQQLVRAKAGIAQLAVEEHEVTVLFSDIENFTKICECLGVGDKLLSLMSDYFTAMADIIASTGGCLLEFIGDAVLAVWNAPNPENMHAVRAVTAALEMHAFLESVAAEWDAKGYPRVRIRCGIHTAKVLVGNLGAPHRMKYGVLGDGVNTASRLEETNKRYGTRTLISEATFNEMNRQVEAKAQQTTNSMNQKSFDLSPKSLSRAIPSSTTALGSVYRNSTVSCDNGFFQYRPVDRVLLKGKTIPTTLYEVVDFRDETKSRSTPNSAANVTLNTPHAKFLFERAKKAVPNASREEEEEYTVIKNSSGQNCQFDDQKVGAGSDLVIEPLDDDATIQASVNNIKISAFKTKLLEVHNKGWEMFLKREFFQGYELFSLVEEMQKELGPRTKVSELPNDFGDDSAGDKAAALLKVRCEGFIKRPPPRGWDGTEVLHDKHF